MSKEAAQAGESAARYLAGAARGETIRLEGQNGVRYTVPQLLDPVHMADTVTVRFRVAQPRQNAALCAYAGGRLLRRVPRRVLTPGEMEQFVLRREEIPAGTQTITFTVEEGAQ